MHIIWKGWQGRILALIFHGLVSISGYAQVLHHINHGAGTQTYGQIDVTVTATGSFRYNSGCFGEPYWIGHVNGTSDYKFSFSMPVRAIRVKFALTHTQELFQFKINNQDYTLQTSNLTGLASPNTICICGPDTVFRINSQGYLNHYGHYPPAQNGCIQVDIQYPGISSFEIIRSQTSPGHTNSGTIVTPYFLEDTTTFIQQPFTDTVKCPGDSLALVYSTNFRFGNNNVFTAQLSNASGSFASPINIGSHADTSGDTIWCRIPDNIPAGNGYRIRIVSSNPADTSLDNQANIRIKAAPANVSAVSNSPVCTGDTLRLLGSSDSTNITWAWTGPGSFSSGTKDTFIANAQLIDSGQYILKATLNSSGCSLIDTTTVEMRPTPDKPVAGSNSPVCEFNSLQLTVNSPTSGVSYSWNGPGSYSSGTQNPTVTSSASSAHAGDYISIVTLNGCSNKDTATVVVLPKPAKPTAAAPNSPLCQRQDLQLTASTVTGASYNWYGPSAFIANVQNPVRQYVQLADAGTYYVYATINGCISDTDSVAVVVNTDPFVNVFPTPGATICPGRQVVFTAVPTNGGTSPTYAWYRNGIATGSTGLTYTTSSLTNGDIVYCLMTSVGACATPFIDTSNPITMTVLPVKIPKVSISADAGPSLFPNEPINFTATYSDAGPSPTFQWRRSGKDVQGATGDVWGANANFLADGDEICVLINSSYECPLPDTVLSNCIKLQIRVGVDDVAAGDGFRIYPNPVRDVLYVEGPHANAIIDLVDVMGRTCAGTSPLPVRQAGYPPSKGGIVEVDVRSLVPGVYVVRVDGVVVGRVVVR